MIKLLLDENLPVKLKRSFEAEAYTVYTVRDLRWNSLEDGDLLKAMETEGFDALITADKNLKNQQNLSPFSFRVIALNTFSNRLEDVLLFVPKINGHSFSGVYPHYFVIRTICWVSTTRSSLTSFRAAPSA